MSFNSFGYEAEEFLSEQLDQESARDFYLIENFKMRLNDEVLFKSLVWNILEVKCMCHSASQERIYNV